MHFIFNGISVNGRQISEIENCDDVPKKIELVFEIGLPVDETQFSKTVKKNDKTGAFYKIAI